MATKRQKQLQYYAGPKSMKTSILATVPRGARLHVLDADNGAASLEEVWTRAGHRQADLTVRSIDRGRSPALIFGDLKQSLWSAPKGYDFYAIDTYTKVALFLTHAIVGVGDRKYNQSTNADLSAWVLDLWWQYARSVEALDAWLVTIFHEVWLEVADGLSDPNDWRNRQQIIAPMIPGSSAARTSIPGDCDLVFHVEKGRGVRAGKAVVEPRFRTKPTPFITASCRGYDSILSDLEPANIAQIIQKCKLTWKKGAASGSPQLKRPPQPSQPHPKTGGTK